MSKQIQTLHQKQTLSMSTSMHQSISILQMSNVELTEFAMQELGKNPFIEDGNITTDENKETLDTKDKLYQEPYQIRSNQHNNYSNQEFLENIASEKSLKDHITEQMNLSFQDSQEKLIAYFLLDSLTPSGYLGITVKEASNILKCKEQLIDKVLKTLHTFDPAGIFARDLKECLLIQLNEHQDADPSLITMVHNIDLIASGELKKLSKLCDVNISNISTMIKQIKSLNPKPANGFFVEQIRYKIPDVILTFNTNGVAKLEINPDALPRLRVNNEYYTLVKDNLKDKEEKEFTRNEIEAANIIVKSIEQRGNTILRVAGAIIEEQIDFFTRGIMYLKPLTLNKIAVATGFNESTISRSTANKYIATPNGIYELKYFFSSSLGTTRSSSESISSTKVKELIKQIILSEESDHILSDDDISEQLSKFNVSIARRTVAKYREAIGIPTSSLRKKTKSLY